MRRICALLLGLSVVAGNAGLYASAHAADADGGSDTPPPSLQVQTAPLQKGSLPRQVLAYGTLQAEPAAEWSATAPVASVVDQVFVHGGQTIRAGTPLLRLQPTPETQLNEQQALSALKVASGSLQHTQRLLAEHLATAQQLTEAQKALADARATLQALQAQGAAGPRLLRAPFDALVLQVSAGAGHWVSEGSSLLELVRPAALVLVADVAPIDATDIVAGDAASVHPLGLSPADDAAYPGRVLDRSAMIDAESGTIAVRLALLGRTLLAGQSARVTITTGSVAGYLVPHSAVLLDDNGSSYVVQAVGGVAHEVAVRVLAQQGPVSAIDGPLDAAAPLVLAGNYQVEEGMRLVTSAATAH